MAGTVEGLRFIGSRLEAALVVDQLRPDIRRLCALAGVDEHDVTLIEYEHGDGGRLVFHIANLSSGGEATKVTIPTPWPDFPAWWIPFDGGFFVDHALEPSSA